MHFLKNVFITLFFVVTTSTSHRLNAMESKAMTAMLEESVASDFQIYQLLSFVTKDNPQLYLPDEVTQIIALNAYEITEKLRAECYEEYRSCLGSPGIVLSFIEDSFKKSMSHTVIVNILKTCLNYSGKSLSEIKDSYSQTVIHHLIAYWSFNLDFVKIIFLVAGDQAWDLITIKNCNGNMALHYPLQSPAIKELLSMALSPEQAWLLINTPNNDGKTPLSLAMRHNADKKVIKILESYRPKEQ